MVEVLNKNDLANYVNAQLHHFYPDKNDAFLLIIKNIDEAMDRMLYSLKHVKLAGYTKFSHLHSDLYAQFIYYLSNTIWKNDANKNIASKLFYLNKTLHSLNCMYDTDLPDIFLLIHCVGSVLGKASYNNYFVACHNVTVGTDRGFAPIISEKVYMGPGSSIVGKSFVASNSLLTINTVVLNQDTNNDSIVIGYSPKLTFYKMKRNLFNDQYFK